MHCIVSFRWSLLRCHCGMQAKILVFLTTGKQVKFALEAFRRLRPGVVLRALHGKMKQMKRMAVFYDFSEVLARLTVHLSACATWMQSVHLLVLLKPCSSLCAPARSESWHTAFFAQVLAYR